MGRSCPVLGSTADRHYYFYLAEDIGSGAPGAILEGDSYTNITTSVRRGGWNLNDRGAGGLCYDNGAWNAIGNTSPAFSVEGITSAAAAEPGTAALIPIAIGGLLWLRRRARRGA